MHSHKQNFIFKPPKRKLHEHLGFLGNILVVSLRLLPYVLVIILCLAVLALVVIAAGVVPHYASLKNVYVEAQLGQQHMLTAEAQVREYEFSQAETELQLAKESFIEAQKSLAVVDNSFLMKSSYFRNQYDVANDVLFIGEELANSVNGLCVIGARAMDAVSDKNMSFEKIDAETKGELLAVLISSMNELKDVRRNIGIVGEKLREINTKQPLFIFDKVVDPLQAKIPQIEKAFDASLSFLRALPWLTGYPEEKTYLFILENNREMRPAGGFIGTYGIFQVANAEIKNFYTDNSYNLDVKVKDTQKIPAPKPMEKYMAQPNWFFRDSNWWPDWPTSAEKIAWFYAQEGGTEKLDGVIAITPTVIEQLLGFLGEFEIGGLKFNQQNFWEQLQYQVEFGYYKQGIDAADRKDIIGDLSREMIKRLYSYPISQWPDLIDTISKSVKEKHILIYFFDPLAQSVSVENGWAGEVKTSPGDYVMLVDANLAALKTDSVMARTMIYNLHENKDGAVLAEARVNYQNMGTFTWKTTRYRSYTRLYVPDGSHLISVEAGGKVYKPEEVDTVNEFGKTSFAVFFEVEPQTSKEVVWKYQLPNSIVDQIKNGEYQLLVQKQPGIEKMNLQLNLNFSTEVKDVSASKQTNKQTIKQTSVLRQDEQYSVWFNTKK